MNKERENMNATSMLTPRDYVIAGNDITAYYDAAGKLVFVLDKTINADKPNVLLVINPVGNRKWDDILSNDYDVDLETVRPKKDNKYQKLDIEYAGLGRYDALIAAYDADDDVTGAVRALDAFRHATIRRAATDRLNAAEEIATHARETIERTEETIRELTVRARELRSKLITQKKSIGREPTKQTASKILRTEAQIDAVNDKLKRAKKRLSNAQRRLAAAAEDADMAREILDRVPDTGDVADIYPVSRPVPTDVAPMFQSVSMDDDDADDDVMDMNDDDDIDTPVDDGDDKDVVEPLFDRDPKIIDESIAFKPIDFNIPTVESADMDPVVEPQSEPEPVIPMFTSAPMFQDVDVVNTDAPAETTPSKEFEELVVEPLSFTPPTARERVDADSSRDTQDAINVVPILDTTPETPAAADAAPAPVLDSIVPIFGVDDVPHLSTDDDAPRAPANAAPDIAPAPALSDVRPVSPITGMAPVTDAPRRGRPTLMYYILLGLLIVLSIFTLWLYQQNVAPTNPDLIAVSAGTESDAPVAPVVIGDDNPFISAAAVTVESADVMPNVQSVEPVPADAPVEMDMDVAPVDAPAPTPVPADVPEMPVSIGDGPAPVADMPAENSDDVIFNTIETDVVADVAPDAGNTAPVVNKPAYDVSGDKTVVPVSDAPYCDDGTAPDANGCCAGETYTDMGEHGMNCCPNGGGDCFPPMW